MKKSTCKVTTNNQVRDGESYRQVAGPGQLLITAHSSGTFLFFSLIQGDIIEISPGHTGVLHDRYKLPEGLGK